MTAVIAPTAAFAPATSAPQGRWSAPARGPAPRISFRSLCAGFAPRFAPLTARGVACPPSTTGVTASGVLQRRGVLADQDDPLDPVHRHRAALAAPDALASCTRITPHASFDVAPVSPSDAARSAVRAAASLEDLVPALVRRIAWSGDRHRGTVRLELGAGELAGATLLVHADDGHVRVHLDVPPGVDANRWQERIRCRLASRGVRLEALEVT
jgi:hypothetical protein